MVACYVGVDVGSDLKPEHRAALLTHTDWRQVHFPPAAPPDLKKGGESQPVFLSNFLDAVIGKVATTGQTSLAGILF